MAEIRPLITSLFPGLTPEELQEAEETLRRYFLFIARLNDRIASDPKEQQRLRDLTVEHQDGNIKHGRTFTNQYPDTDV